MGRALVPEISVTDPRLLATMPGDLAAATGLDGTVIESVSGLPGWLTRELAKMRGAADTAPATGPGWVQVPMTLDGAVLGRLIAH